MASDSPHFIIEFVGADDVPKADIVGHADPYIFAWLCKPPAGSTFEKIGEAVRDLSLSGSLTTSSPNLTTSKSSPKPGKGKLLQKFKRKFKPMHEFSTAEIKEMQQLRSGDLVRSERIYNHKDPRWFCVRDFRLAPSDDDFLVVVMYDWDKTDKDDLLASLAVPVGVLRSTADLIKVPFTLYKKAGLETSLTLRHIPAPSPFPARRTLFLIRHGESQWNEAQGKKNAKGMIQTTDHGLNLVGIQQAQAFNKKWRAAAPSQPRADQFRAAEHVFVSPLTRAIQTCFLTLDCHPAMVRGCVALPSMREAKNLGGLDTIGKKCGDDIKPRVLKQFQKVLSPEQLAQINVGYDIDVSRCPHPWWTPAGNKEGSGALSRRILDFLSTVQFSGSDAPAVLVGHSLLFKEFVRTHLSPEFQRNNPEFSHKLCTYKLGNASCLAVDVVFQPFPLSPAEIVNAELVFDSDFHYE